MAGRRGFPRLPVHRKLSSDLTYGRAALPPNRAYRSSREGQKRNKLLLARASATAIIAATVGMIPLR